ncbi:MAG: hypothetical protein ACRD7E_01070 [Bryobacteraceae bacterium]
MDQNAQAQVLKALLRQRELLDKQIDEIVDGMIRSTPQQSTPIETAVTKSARRRLSPAAKKRMADATRKRWKQYRQTKAADTRKAAETPEKPPTKKRSARKSPVPAKSA